MLTFYPVQHMHTRWPDWTVHMGALDDGETHAIYPRSRTLFVNPVGISPILAIAHVVGHLELGHHLTQGERLTDEQCTEAAFWASLSVGAEQEAQWPRWSVVAKAA